jgi:hypothetical protein
MRLAVVVGACILAACASERLAPKAPTGVDLSGHWVLDEADSDDAQRLMQSQLTAATNATAQATAARRQGRSPAPGAMGPVMPPVMVLDEGLRWPGKDVSIRQAGGLITFSSLGNARDCRLAPSEQPAHSAATRGRGDAPPPRCGWDKGTLVVVSGEPEENRPPYEQRFSVSADGEQLVELVVFKGGRSDGFTASRVWHRAPATTSAAPQKPPQ